MARMKIPILPFPSTSSAIARSKRASTFMMLRLLHPVLIGLGVGIAMVFVVEFISGTVVGASASNGPGRSQPAAANSKPAPLDVDSLVAEILERPLFSPSRQPADAAPPAEAQNEKPPPQLPGRLAGVTIRPEAREALFEQEGQKPIAVKEGQQISGWTVASIQLDQVVLKSAAGEEVIKPANNTRRPQVQAMNKKPAAATRKGPNATPASAKKPLPAQPNAKAAKQTARQDPRTGRYAVLKFVNTC